MRDIRPIREEECEPFLHVLCDTFGLDFERALPLFTKEPMFDLNRKWATFQGREITSVLTTTSLQFGWGKAIGIAGVATVEKWRGEGHATQLIRKVLRAAEQAGEGPALLFAADTRLYETIGFEGIDRVVTGKIATLPIEVDLPTTTFEQVRSTYDEWASQDSSRLVRDERRWQYWNWNHREAYASQGGYFTLENGSVRECLTDAKMPRFPVARGTEWLGTAYMTDLMEIPMGTLSVPMYLLGYNFPGIPQLFMTDQF